MPGFVLRPRARADLDEIWAYTAETWNEDQAERYVRLIVQACHDLASGAIRGRSADSIRPGYFRRTVGSHILFYLKVADGGIDVVRILHQRMDVGRHL